MAMRTEQVMVREVVRKVTEKDSARGDQLRSLLQTSDTKEMILMLSALSW